MSSRYHQTTTTSRSGPNYASNNHHNVVNGNVDNQLDELLEDLQMSVSSSRSGPNHVQHHPHQMVNGGATKTGYREIIKSARTETMGKPVESVKEYRVEYLNPSNTTTVIQERSSSPFYNHSTINEAPGRNSSYRTVEYQYNTARSGNSEAIPSSKYQQQTVRSAPDVKFKQNINELDSLLDDLNQTQNATFQTGSNNYQYRTMDNAFPQPLEFSTPQKNQKRLERIEQRTYEEQRYGTVNPSPIKTTEVKKEIIYNGDVGPGMQTATLRYEDRSPSRAVSALASEQPRKDLASSYTTNTINRYRESSPAPPALRQIQEVYRYETKTSSTRKGNEIPVSSTIRNYTYDTDTTGNAVPFIPNERQQSSYSYTSNGSPSPGARSYSSTYASRESTGRRSPSPSLSRYYSSPPPGISGAIAPGTPTTLSKTTYSTIRTSQEMNRKDTTANTTPRTPSSAPYRSPSPASFPQPPDSPEPTLKTYQNFERTLKPAPSPQPTQKFSPSDPSSREIGGGPLPPATTPIGKTIIAKNYSYSSQHHRAPSPIAADRYPHYNGYPEQTPPTSQTVHHHHIHYNNRYHPADQSRSFPSPTPTTPISEQRPPKQLDELMATFSDTEISTTNRYNNYSSSPTIDHLAIGAKSTPPPTPVQTTLIPTPIEKIPEKQKITEVYQEKSNGIAGPPVYYPPGPLFAGREESAAMMESSSARGKGKMKASRKAKYKYESESRMRESSTTKKTVVPLCLPVCCALPCVIM